MRLSYSGQNKHNDKHSQINISRQGDFAQLKGPISPSGMYRKFHHPWSKDLFRFMKVLSSTNYLVDNTQPQSPFAS